MAGIAAAIGAPNVGDRSVRPFHLDLERSDQGVFAIDHDVALRRLEKAGAVVTTAEAVGFEWAGGSDHPRFKEFSKLVQQRMQALA